MKIIAVAGPIGAGKSELSRAIARDLGAVRVSFGDFVRREANARDIEPSRHNLQELGEKLIAKLGAAEFVHRVLEGAHIADVLVVDGVRHLAIDEALRKAATQYALMFVYADDETRRRRLSEREEGHEIDLAGLDSHSTEREIPLLRRRATTLVDGTQGDAALARIREVLRSRRDPGAGSGR